MKNFSLLYPMVLIGFYASTQPSLNWNREADTTTTSNYQFIKMAADALGSIYLLGYKLDTTFTVQSMQLCKYDQFGNLLWQQNDTGSGNYMAGEALCLDNTNDVYVTGTEQRTNTGRDVFISKYSSAGNLLWKRYFNGNDTTDEASSITFFNSHVYITGNCIGVQGRSRLLIQKYDLAGNLKWTKIDSLNNVGSDVGLDITHDKTNIVITGYSDEIFTGNYKMVLAKFDQSGNKLWQFVSTISGLGYQAVTDGVNNIYVRNDIGIEKYDSLGNFLWSKRAYPTIFGHPAHYYDIKVDSSNNIVTVGQAGIVGGFDGIPAFLTSKFSENGDTIFSYHLSDYGLAYSVDFLSDNDILAAGKVSNSEERIINFDALGNIKWQVTYSNDVPNIYGYAMLVDAMKNVFVGGGIYRGSPVNRSYMEIVKYDDNLFSDIENQTSFRFESKVHPNPATNTITLSNLTPHTPITITNLLGEVVIKDVADSERKEIDVSRLAAGMYFVNKRKLVKE